MSAAVYDPGDVHLIFGLIPVWGYASGTMIKVEQLGDGDKVTVGGAGEACFVESADQSARITFTLFASANANALLQAVLLAGNPVLPVALTAPGIGYIAANGKLARSQPPGVELGADAPTLEWAIIIDRLSGLARGHVLEDAAGFARSIVGV